MGWWTLEKVSQTIKKEGSFSTLLKSCICIEWLHISKQEGFGDMLAAIANLNLNLLTEVNHDVHHCVFIYMGREGFEPP